MTRIEESLKKDRKKSYYNVVSATGSETKLRLKISKIPSSCENRGTKRNIMECDEDEDEEDYTPSKNLTRTKRTGTPIKDMEIHGEFSVSMSERVKRRRKVVAYDESDSDGEEVVSQKRRKRKLSDDDFICLKNDDKGKEKARSLSPIDCKYFMLAICRLYNAPH